MAYTVVATVVVFIITHVVQNVCFEYEITYAVVNLNSTPHKLPHFWESTGLCPPDPKNEIHKWLLSNDVKVNLALIGAIPNRGIKQVRIHWLLNLIKFGKFNDEMTRYNFTYLDQLLDWLHKQKLRPGFEIMGHVTEYENLLKINAGSESNFSSRNENVYKFWYDIVLRIVSRYKERYGAREVAKWRFETWNEPDLKSYNVLNFTLREYLSYANACADGLREVFKGTGAEPKLGGPAGLFKQPVKHPLCWGFLEFCNRLEEFQYPIQYVSFHKKGDGTVETLLNRTFELLDYIHFKYRNLRRVPIANDEADILPNWSISENWRGDARYAAMVFKVAAEYYRNVILGRQLKVEVLSNDNGFLNYDPYYFTQRTLMTRFQMNNTDPPHVQFVKKPVYAVMGLLSLLGDEYLQEEISPADPLITILAARCSNAKCKTPMVSALIGYANDTAEDRKCVKKIRVVFNNLHDHNSKYVIYVLDNVDANPFAVWKNAGSPSFPAFNLRQQMRDVQEPKRLQGPSTISNANLNVTISMSLPSVVLVHVCLEMSEVPGRVTYLQVFNVTRNEVLLVWKDVKVRSKCIRTYEVEFKGECENGIDERADADVFSRVNINDTIFLSYHHAMTGDGACEATLGKYRVRAVDYWGRPGNYSNIVSYS